MNWCLLAFGWAGYVQHAWARLGQFIANYHLSRLLLRQGGESYTFMEKGSGRLTQFSFVVQSEYYPSTNG